MSQAKRAKGVLFVALTAGAAVAYTLVSAIGAMAQARRGVSPKFSEVLRNVGNVVEREQARVAM
jgi:hypothetical protein